MEMDEPTGQERAEAAQGDAEPAGGGRTARTQAQVRAFISLLVAADELQREVDGLLKTADLTSSQYNVLRILRGGEPDGLRCGDVTISSWSPSAVPLLDAA